MGVVGERFRIPLEEIEEPIVPLRIQESEPLAVELMRESAGPDDGDAAIARIAFDRALQRLSQPEAASRRRERMLDDVDRERENRRGPGGNTGTGKTRQN